MGYEIILSRRALKVVRCNTVNPATLIIHEALEVGEEHDCATYIPEGLSQAEADPIPDSDMLFVDGSFTTDQETEVRHTEAAVVRTHNNRADGGLWVSARLTLLSRFSAQAAELIALIETLTLSTGKTVTIYSDSTYVTTTVHSSIARWRRRGFLKSDCTLVMHRELLKLLIDALVLLK